MSDYSLYVEFQNGEDSYGIECDPQKTIKELKNRIKKKYGIPEFCQKLYFKDIELYDNKILSDYMKFSNGLVKIYNLNKLKLFVNVRNKIFEYILKASDSIFNLKELIFKNLSIPFNKMKITNPNKIIDDDNQLIEDFIPNLNFEIEISNVDKIKINVINGNSTEIIFIDPYSYTDDIYTKLNKNYKFRLVFNGKNIDTGRLLCEYLNNNDSIEIVKDISNKIRIKVRVGAGDIRIVCVSPDDSLFILSKMLDIKDKSSKFAYKGIAYNIFSILTFREINLTEDSTLYIMNKALG